jgi:predicted Zn-dependent protease
VLPGVEIVANVQRGMLGRSSRASADQRPGLGANTSYRNLSHRAWECGLDKRTASRYRLAGAVSTAAAERPQDFDVILGSDLLTQLSDNIPGSSTRLSPRPASVAEIFRLGAFREYDSVIPIAIRRVLLNEKTTSSAETSRVVS